MSGLVAGLLTSCSGAQPVGDDVEYGAPEHLSVARVMRGSISDVVPAVGRIRPATQVEVGAELNGRIVSVDVDFDEPVRAGQVLARIDPEPYEAALARAEAGLRSAVADRNEVAARLAAAERQFERTRELAARGAVPDSRVEDQEFELAQIEAAHARAEAGVALARSQVDQVRIDLSNTEITSPIDGFVLDRRVETGQTVNATLSTPVLFIIAADLSNVVIEAEVAEADVARIQEGMDVRFRVDAYPREIFFGVAGPVRRAANVANRFVTYPVAIAASDPDERLLPGMTASIEFVAAEAYGELVAPRRAFTVGYPAGFEPSEETERWVRDYYSLSDDAELVPDYRGAITGVLLGEAIARGMRVVYVWHDGRIESRHVRAGPEDAENFAVIGGDLEEGDLVIIDARDPELEL
ncbi:efflux RND transporter periplasmic adaptor subunit [uncultured Maricaulis sp.]|uniref:efflux RND transporter periplasmic adaptor subunit n=1 Tax=uncultured Maricaulis sp. TaxID=174710 RepID=UPI0026260644|nr:efflux RND transporter periplasmic adaptor subunit [uncultured Maricaulis sp.]